MIRTLFLCITVATCLCSCTKTTDDNSSIAVFLVVDKTDPMELLPDYATMERLFDFDNHPDRAIVFRAEPISDMQLNTALEAAVPSGQYTEAHNTEDNIDERNNSIRAFNGGVRNILKTLTDTAPEGSSLANSECFRTIASALTRLKELKADAKLLRIYSDLGENSSVTFFKKGQPLSMKDTGAIEHTLLSLAPLPDKLDGIHVCLLFRPKNREEDLRYAVLSSCYKNLLTARGARVAIAASNSIEDQ